MFSFLNHFFESLTSPLLRPPGALNEKRLLATCIKCGRCMEVCPTGSLREGKKEEAAMGLAHIVKETCLSWQGDICNLCFKRCPLKDKAITLDDDLRPVIEDCVGCGVCLYVCPTKPKSIYKVEVTCALGAFQSMLANREVHIPLLLSASFFCCWPYYSEGYFAVGSALSMWHLR